MQRVILVYGALSGTILVALFGLTMGLVSDHGTLGMVLGFLSMFAAMSMVFVGVKRFRDEFQGGVIGFAKAFGVGLGIAAVASLFYVLGWEVYMWATDYRFMADYLAATVAQMQASGSSPADIAKFKADMAGMAEMYRNPAWRMLITLSEIAPVTLLVPLLSAALLRNPRFLPARG